MTRIPTPPPARVRGFTLIEVLVVLALVALLSTVVLPAGAVLLERVRPESARDTLAGALEEARKAAVLSGHTVVLRIAGDGRGLAWTGSEGADGRTLREPGVTIALLRPRPAGSVLVGGRLEETAVAGHMTFFPDGTCDRRRFQLRRSDGDRANRVIEVDPWTCTLRKEER